MCGSKDSRTGGSVVVVFVFVCVVVFVDSSVFCFFDFSGVSGAVELTSKKQEKQKNKLSIESPQTKFSFYKPSAFLFFESGSAPDLSVIGESDTTLVVGIVEIAGKEGIAVVSGIVGISFCLFYCFSVCL